MRFLKKILPVLFLIFLIISAGIFYLNTIFLPLQAKDILIAKAKDFLNRNVSIETIKFSFAKGFVLQNIRIFQKETADLPFVDIEEIKFQIILPDFFRTGNIFVPSATIKKPSVYIHRINGRGWNFADLLEPSKTKEHPTTKNPRKQPFLSIGEIHIEKGALSVSNESSHEKIEEVNMTARFLLDKSLSFNANFIISENLSTFNANGKFLFDSRELLATVKTQNLNCAKLINLSGIPLYVIFDQWMVTNADLKIHLKNEMLTLSGLMIGQINLTTKTSAPVKIKSRIFSKNFLFHKKGRNFDIAGEFKAPDTTIALAPDKILTGYFTSKTISLKKTNDQFVLTGDLLGQKTQLHYAKEKLNANIELKQILFNKTGPKIRIKTDSQITNGVFTNSFLNVALPTNSIKWDFQKDEEKTQLEIPDFSTQNLSGFFLATQVAGHVQGKNIHIGLSGETLDAVGQLKTQDFNLALPNNLILSGNPRVDLTIRRSPLRNNNKIDYRADITFIDETLKGVSHIGEIKNLNGQLSLGENEASTAGLALNLGQTALSIAGVVKDFHAPSIDATLSGEKFQFSFTASKTKDKISLSRLLGRYQKTGFDLQGNILFHDGPPEIDLTGKISLELSDLLLFPVLKDTLKTMSPAGTAEITGQYAINGFFWENISVNAMIKADQITLYGFLFTNISAAVSTLADNQKIIKLNSMIADGKLSTDATLSLNERNIPCRIVANLKNIDLKKLKTHFPNFKDSGIAGLLSINSSFNGPLLDYKALTGEGSITITEGKLLELEILKGIWKILFTNLLVEDYRKIAFTQGQATFKIQNGRIASEDLILKSAPADISARGSVGFDTTLNFDIIAKVRDLPLVNSATLQTVPTTIISQIVKNVIGIKLTGSVSSPKIKYRVLPLKVLQKTTSSVFQGISGMLEDVLNQ